MGMVLSAVGACLLFILKVVGILLLIILVLAALLLLCPLRGCLLAKGYAYRKSRGTGHYLPGVPIPKAGTSRPAGGAQGLYRQAESKIPRMACGAQAQKG